MATIESYVTPLSLYRYRSLKHFKREIEANHVHVQGRLVSSTYDKQYGKGKKPTVVKQTFWQVRANSIRKLNRAESQPGSAAVGAEAAAPSDNGDGVPF